MPNHIQNRVTFDCSEEKLNEILTAIQKDSGENGNFGPGTVDFNKIIPMPDNIFKGLLGTEEKKIYGKNNWYDWSIENWGTKWNAYSFSRDGNTIGFQTAWSAPHPILAELIRDLYSRKGIIIEGTTRLSNIAQRYEAGKQYAELLISNYDTTERYERERQCTLFDMMYNERILEERIPIWTTK